MSRIIQTAGDYHQATEYDRNAMQGHRLDWPNQPDVYKRYSGSRSIPLPRPEKAQPVDLSRLSGIPGKEGVGDRLDKALLGDLLQRAYCLTARARHSGQDFYYRSVASAGALYPTELYLSAGNVADLVPGLYHYGIGTGSLTPLREQNIQQLVNNAIGQSANRKVGATFIITGIIFRSAWKYRSRAYRYVLLDAGHLLENLLLALRSLDLPFSFGYDFADEQLNPLVGVDGHTEVCLAYVNLFIAATGADDSVRTSKPVAGDVPVAGPVSHRTTTYQEIEHIQTASSVLQPFNTPNADNENDIGVKPSEWLVTGLAEPPSGDVGYPEVIYRRRSKRNFVNGAISKNAFYYLIDLVCGSLRSAETEERVSRHALQVGVLVGQGEGLLPGFYLIDPDERTLGLVSTGNMIGEMSAVCLNQEWLANAALHFLFLTNLDVVDGFGSRGYRHVMQTSGRLGQMLYLGAEANRLGCCGIGALYDGEARSLLGLNTASALLYLVAVGPVKRRS